MLIFELDFFLYFVDKKNFPQQQYEIHHSIELSTACDLLLAISITICD